MALSAEERMLTAIQLGTKFNEEYVGLAYVLKCNNVELHGEVKEMFPNYSKNHGCMVWNIIDYDNDWIIIYEDDIIDIRDYESGHAIDVESFRVRGAD